MGIAITPRPVKFTVIGALFLGLTLTAMVVFAVIASERAAAELIRDSYVRQSAGQRVPSADQPHTESTGSTNGLNPNATLSQKMPVVVGIGGALLILSFVAIAWSIGMSRSRAAARAEAITAELAQANAAAEEANERLKLATRAGGVGVWDWDVVNNRLVWDDQMYRLYGITREQFGGAYEAWRAGVHPDEQHWGDAEIELALRGEQDFDTEFRVVWPNGSVRTIRAMAIVQRDQNGKPIRMTGTNWDVTELDELAAKARSAEQFLISTIDSLDTHTVVVGSDGRIVSLNRAWSDFAHANNGPGDAVLEGANYLDVCDRAAPRCDEASVVAEAIRAVLKGDVEPAPIEYPCHAPTERRWFVCTVRGFSTGAERYAVISHQNVTARKVLEEELRTAARLDRLTGLPNRALLTDRLQQAILRAKRHKDYHFAVLFLDFDRFKAVNDSLGHEVGDQLLREIGQRLRATVRSGDSLSSQAPGNTNGRLGGDEFVVILDSLSKPSDAIDVANRLLEVFARPYQLGEHKVHSTASIGIYTSDMPAESADDVLRDADTAMYEAKLAGKGRYMVFDVTMRQRVQNRLNLENDLRDAVDSDQLFLMYQPIVSLETGQLDSVEALIRWKHPVRGLISPGDFIPIAEETGLIVPIGQWVLDQACSQFAIWQNTLGASAPRSVSINLSRKQLVLEDLPEIIRRTLNQAGMAPECLHLEVTESAIMKDAAAATRLLGAIKEIGVKLAIDDFGTGYSSLACLHQFPLDILKIDRSFVANIDRGRDFAAMVHAVAQLARNLNIQVVAEGIETAEQALVLQTFECEFGQGYYFCRPVMPDQLQLFSFRPTLTGQQAA
ncbi:putative bifunctional diguanylate cyclase/phosphodiesterase [Humisphaera borealis]|uniref:EAL domain-containing protein n=1 Tax=Humisphaera borealis TaxID=2807512 RepID=A0A7M2WZJ4_9BACT|nr:GGDEF and EAL domain-containing protein [Humisphaera borealis]QOV90937.1 EAL domain-containing protein [Humisphaera borealis]